MPPRTRSGGGGGGGGGGGHRGGGGQRGGPGREHRGDYGENRAGGQRGGRNEERANRGGYGDGQGQGFAQSRSEHKPRRPDDINTHIPSSIRRLLREGSHYLYLNGQLTEIETNVSLEDFTVVDDGDISLLSPPPDTGTTVNDRRMITHAAAKAVNQKGPHAWETLLRPLTSSMPLPVEISAVLTKHFDTPPGHRPADLSFKGIQIRNYAQYRDTTSCFVCAALCNEIIYKTAEQVHYLRPQTPALRYTSNITLDMTAFLNRNPKLAEFLTHVQAACANKDPEALKILFPDPERLTGEQAAHFDILRQELTATYLGKNEALLLACIKELPLAGWISAQVVVHDYLRLLRDSTNPMTEARRANYKKLVDDAIVALGDPTYGYLILPTVLEYSRYLALVVCKPLSESAGLSQSTNSRVDSQSSTKYAKFLEECANSLREAFIRCLGGGSIGSAAHSTAPDGKRQGIYITSNSCLKLLRRCGKLRNATQIFVSIDAQSPYLDFYPRAQRVTYLYYLGTYHFTNNHFFRAQLALQAAYDLCHRQDSAHRRQILTYLIAANICLGRFPSETFLSRHEATDLAPHFYPLCKIIAQGDLGTFQKHLDLNSETSQWFLRKRILLQLRNRGEVLVWRTLIQKTFRYAGHQPAGDRMVPFLRLLFVQTAAQFSLERAKIPSSRTLTKQGTFAFETQQLTPPAEDAYTDPDLDGVDAAVNETGFDVESGFYDDAQVGQLKESLLTTPNQEASPSMAEVESIFSSLILQGFLRGFLTHGEKPRFAVPGSGPYGGPLVHGFPNIWQVIQSREDDTVPGWVRKDQTTNAGPSAMQAGFGAGGGGRVVNLSGARPVGAAP